MLLEIARGFKECMHDMEGRKPGPTSIKVDNQFDCIFLFCLFIKSSPLLKTGMTWFLV